MEKSYHCVSSFVARTHSHTHTHTHTHTNADNSIYDLSYTKVYNVISHDTCTLID